MVTWKQLSQSVLTGAAAGLYTAQPATYASIHAVSLWNPTAGAVVVTFYIVPASGVEGDATTVESITVAAGKSASVPNLVNHKMMPGMSLWALGAGVTCTVSGAENVPS